LDEDTVVFDVLDDSAENYPASGIISLEKGRVKLHVDLHRYVGAGYDTGVLHPYSFHYWKDGTWAGDGEIYWYLMDNNENLITGKIIGIVYKSWGDGTTRWEIWKGGNHIGPDLDPANDAWKKLIFPLPQDVWIKHYLYNGAGHSNAFWIDFIGIFNKF
jgi:hypothetical protein